MNKTRILAAMVAATSMAGAMAMEPMPYHGEGHVMINAGELRWEPVASMAPGAKLALLEGDLATADPFTFRLKLPAGYTLAPHVHPAYERVTVLSGALHFGHGRHFDRNATVALEPGGFAVMAPGEPMFGYTVEQTVIQLHGHGPWGIEYIDPEDDPRL
jgi:hypothetical protein